MFGCYRRGDANDPDTYVAAVAMVLSKYPADIIKTVTDPYSGLPARKNENGYSGLPDVADVKEACEAEAVRAERIKRYAALPKPVPRIENGLRGREVANLWVPEFSVKFPALLDRHTAMGADSPCIVEDQHVCADQVVRRCIHVPLSWYERPIKAKTTGAAMPERHDAPEPDGQEPIPFDDAPIEHPEEAAA